jgi:electron transfer flavoprotein beta subunit
MNVLVYVRQILSPGELVEIDKENKQVDDSRGRYQPHPIDEAAVEEAVRLKESVADGQHGEGKVTVVCIGPERTEQDLRAYLAVGADEVIRVWDDTFSDARLDDSTLAVLLTTVAKSLTPDWIICGDDVSTSLAGHLSESLQQPAATAVRAIELEGPGLKVRRKLEKSTATVKMTAPGILAVERGCAPRYPSHRDRLLAKKKTISVLGSADLPQAIQEIAAMAEKLKVEAVTLPKPGKKNYPPTEDGFSRYVGLLLGGMAGGDTGGQVVEGPTEKMADAAVEKIQSLGCI